jgi:release factor glutamine methyltransferase
VSQAPAPVTVVDFLGVATSYLQSHGSPTARLDAELLLGKAVGLRRLQLYLEHDRPLTPYEVSVFRELLRRRGAGEPVAYILGSWEFRGIELAVDRRVLVPRPETESLVELALGFLPQRGRFLDVGTGSGAIALAVARERREAMVVATDISSEALEVARENIARAGLEIEVVETDLLDGLTGRYHVIAANLPYVADDDPRLEPGVRDFEPHVALFAGADGLDVVRRLIATARPRLVSGGWLALEVGEGQAPVVATLAGDGGYSEVVVERDLAGIERFVLARC